MAAAPDPHADHAPAEEQVLFDAADGIILRQTAGTGRKTPGAASGNILSPAREPPVLL
jgi:hypothetical protein